MAIAVPDQQELLRPYLPRLLVQWLSESPDLLYAEVDGSVAFVDISGFTKLSERLARRGKVGAEELTEAIGSCFTRLLGVAYGNGGGLIKFGGDALLLLFTGLQHEAKACRAAVGMRRALREVGALETPGGKVTLKMSVGVHSGLFHFFMAGESQRELIITGPAATETVLMEGTAEAGEIVVSRATAAALPPGILGGEKGTGRLLRREPPGLTVGPPEPDPRMPAGGVLNCIPVAVRENILAGMDDPEHKRVTIAFVHFDETDRLIEAEGSASAAAELDRLVRDVQHAVDPHGITFLGTDIDKDGGKMILAAGAPASSGNDEERMLLALREIADKQRRIPIRIGVNQGHVFAGNIGPAYRRTYTVMGDAVNLAARVMAKAQPGQILATEGVLEGSRTTLETTALEPFMVKGKSQPVQAFALGAVSGAKKTETDKRVPLVGREREMEILRGALHSAREGKGQLVEIIADPGLGKTRLLEELRSTAGDDVVLHSLACELYESSTPYFSFRRPLRRLLGIGERASDAEAAPRLHEVMASLTPQLLPWEPLVGIVIDVGIPETEQTSQLEERFRRPRLNEVVRELFARLLRAPTLLMIEDTHWMDEASADLLRHLAGNLENAPWLLLVTRRDVEEGFSAREGSGATIIRLQPLDASMAAELVSVASEDAPFPPHQIAALAERSGGNPLFLKELLAAAKTEGIETLPDSVEALIMARIDRLAPSDRNLLRRASVIGRRFPGEYLAAVVDEVPPPEDSVWLRISPFIATENGTLSFVHALIRDGAYEGLPYRQRRELHSRVANSIERAAGDTPDEHAELLSLHYFHAQQYLQAWRYSLSAAERAKAIYANVEAAEFYERALGAAKRVDDLVPLEIARVREELGDVQNRMGAYSEASKAYTEVRRRAKGDPLAEARLQLKLASVQGWLHGQTGARRSITNGLRILEGMDGSEAAVQRAQLMVWYAQFCFEGGRNEDTIAWCERTLIEAEKAEDKDAVAHAYRLLGVASMRLGEFNDNEYSWKALKLYEELEDLEGQAWVLNNLGVYASDVGRYGEAEELLGRSAELMLRIGDAVSAGVPKGNRGAILCEQGRLEEAEAQLRGAFRVFQAAGWRSKAAYIKSYLGYVAFLSGEEEAGVRLQEEAREEIVQAGADDWVIEVDARIADCHVLHGDTEKALRLADDALVRARALEGTDAQIILLQRVRAYAYMKSGHLDEAKEALDESVRLAREREASYELARSLLARSRLSAVNGEPNSGTGEEEAQEIIGRLGVVWLPEELLPEPSMA